MKGLPISKLHLCKTCGKEIQGFRLKYCPEHRREAYLAHMTRNNKRINDRRAFWLSLASSKSYAITFLGEKYDGIYCGHDKPCMKPLQFRCGGKTPRRISH